MNINCYRSEDIEKWIVIKNSEASVVKTAAESHSDLVPNVYEGSEFELKVHNKWDWLL